MLSYTSAGAAAPYLPNVWGENSLIAFSGLDGPTCWEKPVVAHGGRQPGTLRFRYPVDTDFSLRWTYDRQYDTSHNETLPACTVGLAASDVMDVSYTHPDGSRLRLSLVFADHDHLLGRICADGVHRPLSVEFLLVPSGKGDTCIEDGSPSADTNAPRVHFAGQGNRIATQLQPDRPFLFAITLEDGPCAADETAFQQAWNARLTWFAHLPRPGTMPGGAAPAEPILRTWYKAWSVVKVNQESAQGAIPFAWTTPDRWPHRHMWLWDSVFHVLPLKQIEPSRAEDTLRAVLHLQHPSGKVSHMGTPAGVVSEITQPPILAWGVWEVYQETRNREFLEHCYPKLVAFLHWMSQEMDSDGSGLCEWVNGGCESGLDNSPRFDGKELFDAVDLNAFLAHDAMCLSRIAGIVAPDEAEQWSRTAQMLCERINARLWHEGDGFYYDRRLDGDFNRLKSCVGFLPLFCGAPSSGQAQRLVEHLFAPGNPWGTFPVATVALDEAAYQKDMWRGPTWLNLDYCILRGLERYGYTTQAAHGWRILLEQVAHWYRQEGVIFEFYDAEGVDSPRRLYRKGGCGGRWINTNISDYHWSAAVYLMGLLPAEATT